MTRDEAIKLLLESKDNDIERSLREWEEWDKRYFEAIDIAIRSLEAWDEVIHSLNCLDRLEYTDCDKPFNVYPKSNVDAIINKYMKEVEDDKGRSG